MSKSEGILRRVFTVGNSYWLTRFVILRMLVLVYAVAFLVAAKQLVPLIGENGLTPATHFLNLVQTQLGSRSAGMLRVPTLFWFGISDDALSIFSWVGFALSLVVLGGYAQTTPISALLAAYTPSVSHRPVLSGSRWGRNTLRAGVRVAFFFFRLSAGPRRQRHASTISG